MARMIDIDDFLPAALRYAPNTSDLVAMRAIRAAAREMCERLKVWRENDEFEILAPDMEGLSTCQDADILEIEAAQLEGMRLEPKTVAWLDKAHPGWSYDKTVVGTARYVTQLAPNTVTVFPGSVGLMKARFVLKPSRDAMVLPEVFLNDYADEISRGAAGHILTEPKSENPQLGLDHRAWFADRLNALAVKALRGQQGAPLRTRGSFL